MAGEIKVAGLKKLLVRLRKTEKRGQDFSEVFRYKIDPEISRLFEKRFKSAGAYGGGGGRWTPLAESTRKSRLRRSTSSGGSTFVGKRGGNRGGVNRPLWDSGNLRGSLVKYTSGGLSLRVITRKTLERGTLVPYAHYHHLGTSRIPDRPIVPDPISLEITERWGRMIGAHITSEDTSGPI